MSKRIIITGANGALGSVTTNYFLGKGYAVTAVLSSMDKRNRLPEHASLEVVALDLSKEAETADFILEQVARHGNIDGALLLAGGFAMGDLSVTDDALFQQQVALNFLTAYHIARPLFAQMKKQQAGRLIFIGARPALEASAGKSMQAYALSKSLLFSLAEQLNAAAKGTDITATVLVPSTIDTAMNRKSMPDADPEKWVKPEQLAAIMEWLFSGPADVLRETVLKVYNNS